MALTLLSTTASTAGVVLGLLAHQGVFIRGEWHVQAPEILISHLLVFGFLSTGAFLFRASDLGYVFTASLNVVILYLITLLTSVLSYRIWFHPLSRAGFKGPLLMRTSKLWHVWQCRNSMNHHIMESLHREFGDFIRTGPSEIAIFHPDVFLATDGPKTECVKSEWYDLLHPESSLLTTRDRTIHDERRRDWKLCFSPQALAYHFQKTLKHIDILDEVIEAKIKKNEPCEMRDLFYWLGFDIMGDFVFNKSFNMLSSGKWHHMVVNLQRALALLGPTSPAPWLIQLAFRVFPRVWRIGDWFKMTDWTHVQIGERLKAGYEKQPTPDLVHYLLEQSDEPRGAESIRKMRGDSLNAIVAGSEPIPVVLIGIFAELARKPEHIEAVFQEVQEIDISDTKALSTSPHLNAVIQEALRLYTVLPTAGPRKVGQSGLTVNGVFIPPYTTIINPRYSIHRRDDCFEKADEFIPERWTTRREMIRNVSAYNPWGTGHYSCIARPMAIDVLRATTARLIKRYRFRLAPGETGKRVLEDMKDQLAPNPGNLTLIYELRM
ncbi:cytochrome P450 [Astrocystis sublimbata]|nr:cytochrome P450 [Astrocystis sublimbata]